MQKLKIFKGEQQCKEFIEYYSNLKNILLNDLSLVYCYNYNYNYEDYNIVLDSFLENLFKANIFNLKNLSLYLVSNLLEPSKFNITKKIEPENNHVARRYNFIIENELLKLIEVKLSNKNDLEVALRELYSGYKSMSFIADSNIQFDEKSFEDLIIMQKNRHDNIIGFQYDYNMLKVLTSELYFSFGGFDFGQFILANF